MYRQTKQTGFTLIELMLAMSFVAVLLVSIALLTIQISNIYTKGVTLRQVNEAGLEVSNDLQRSIQSSRSFNIGESGEEDNVATESYARRAGGGRLCLGEYTYAWNYGKDIIGAQSADVLFNHYANDTSQKDIKIRFVKVADRNKALCRLDDQGAYPPIPTAATDMLSTGDRDLALQRFNITSSTNGGLYSISIVIGTNNGQLQLNDDTCKPPSEGDGFQDYCAVNKFDIVARAGSKEGSNQ